MIVSGSKARRSSPVVVVLVGRWGCSGCGSVLVDESCAGGVSSHRLAWPDRGDVLVVVGRSLAQCPVWAVTVVVVEVLVEEPPELPFVPDDCQVQEFVTERPDPSFGEHVGLGRSWWCPDGGDAGTSEDGVERCGELTGAVADQEPERVIVGEPHQQIAGGLGGPRAGWVGGDPGEVHLSGGDLDDEENMKSPEQRGVDAREVGRDNRLGLGADELGPGSDRFGWRSGQCRRREGPSTPSTRQPGVRGEAARRGRGGSPRPGSPVPAG